MTKILLELLGVGRVLLLSHCWTHDGGNNLCKSRLKLQIGNLIFNHLET
jgi:hypothetical protein